MRGSVEAGISRDVEPDESGEVVELPISESRLRNIVERIVRARFQELLDDVFYGDFATLLGGLDVGMIESEAVSEVVSSVRYYMKLLTNRGINLHLEPDDKGFDEEKKGEVRGAIAPALQAFLFRKRRELSSLKSFPR